ncbi:MAG: hypothetical protein Q7S52_00650 [bacterium]|nr:hypothetical protein [bacterium]
MTHAVLAKFTAYDRKIFWILAGVGAAALFAYIYFISISVLAVVGRKEAELRLGRVSAVVANLESQYAVLDRSIDLSAAEKEGFHEISQPRYVSPAGRGEREVLTLRETGDNR